MLKKKTLNNIFKVFHTYSSLFWFSWRFLTMHNIFYFILSSMYSWSAFDGPNFLVCIYIYIYIYIYRDRMYMDRRPARLRVGYEKRCRRIREEIFGIREEVRRIRGMIAWVSSPEYYHLGIVSNDPNISKMPTSKFVFCSGPRRPEARGEPLEMLFTKTACNVWTETNTLTFPGSPVYSLTLWHFLQEPT